MEYLHIKDIDFKASLDSRVYGIFMARGVDVRQQKNGQQFIALTMCEKDIQIEAKKFGATPEEIEMMKNGGVYSAAIDIKMYNGSPSCVLYNFDVFDENPSNFVEYADGMDHAYQIIKNTLDYLTTTIYGNIANTIIINNWEKFSYWSAASSMHHSMLGGLMVHTSEVIEQSIVLANYWNQKYGEKFINMPLLQCSALLHDIGKIQELDVDKISGDTQYSTLASLETHIITCITYIDKQAFNIKFGEQLEDNSKPEEQIETEKEALFLLKHCILAHHGKLEYSSPMTPNIPEASILHFADSISSEMFRFNKAFKEIDPGESHTSWASGSMLTTYKEKNK